MVTKEILDLREIKGTEPHKDFKFYQDNNIITFLGSNTINIPTLIFNLKAILKGKNYNILLEKTKGNLSVDRVYFRKKGEREYLLEMANKDLIILVDCCIE